VPPIAIGTRRRRTRRLLVVVLVLVALAGLGFLRFWSALAARRNLTANGPSWSFPSRVYSDGVPFTPGSILTPATLRAHLEARGYQPSPSPLPRPGTYAWHGPSVDVWTRGFSEVAREEERLPSMRVRLTLANGRLVRVDPLPGGPGESGERGRRHLATPGLEPVQIGHIYGADHLRRTWVPLQRVPPIVRQAIVASEDRRFYSHLGLDLRSNLRALVANLRAGAVREGASTITQQLARGLFLGPERTIPRKLTEMAIALGIEVLLSKDEILEMYLNSIYWGRADGYGIAGIEEASRYYFGLPVDSLGVREAALLAGIIPAPNASSPFRNPRAARARRASAIRDMMATGVIDTETGLRVLLSPLPDRPGPMEPERHPSYLGHVYESLTPIERDALAGHGLTILTHLDLVAQETAERELTAGVEDLERSLGRRNAPLQGAFVMIDPANGAVRALVGGRDAQPGDFNRASQARRQCGSAIKPVVYAAALDDSRHGRHFTPASVVPDLPREFPTPEGPWKPRNDDGEYHPTVTLAKALAHSINIATANLVDSLEPATVAHYAERFGLEGLKPVASIGLGTNEVTLRDLVSAFAVFPAGGMRCEPTPVRAVYDHGGRALLRPDPQATRAIPSETAALMTNLLEDVVVFGIAYPLRHSYGFMFPLGGKTGTTNDYKDGWFIGFTPEMVAGVWVGYDAPQSLNGPAVNTALPLWARIMTPLFAGRPAAPFASDQTLNEVWLDPWSGGIATASCPSRLRVGMLPGTAPRFLCNRDHAADWERILSQRLSDSLATLARDSVARESIDKARPH
jgi:penicillin-binding protein 1B